MEFARSHTDTHTEKHAHAVDTRDTCGSATSHSVGKILKVVITAGGSLFMFEVMVMCVRARVCALGGRW